MPTLINGWSSTHKTRILPSRPILFVPCFPTAAVEPLSPKPIEPPGRRVARIVLKSYVTRNHQFDFSSCARSAPQFESSPDSSRTLAHSRQTPVTVATPLKDRGVNPPAIVPH